MTEKTRSRSETYLDGKTPVELANILRSPATVFYEYAADDGALLKAAGNLIDRQAAQIEELRKALEPFAKAAGQLNWDEDCMVEVPLRDMRAARAALSRKD